MALAYISQTTNALFHHLFTFVQREHQVSRTEAYLRAIHKLLIWEDPFISGVTLGVLHVLLWLAVQLEVRLYGAVFLTILLLLLADFYFERQNLLAERSHDTDRLHQVMETIRQTVLTLKTLRKDNPSAFCLVMCGFFLILMAIGKSIPGYVLSYLILLFIFICPLLLSKLPKDYLVNVNQAVKSLRSAEGSLAESELIPFISHKDLENDPDAESLVNSQDSLSNSLISGITSMPSFLDAEGSVDDLEDELTLPVSKKSTVSFSSGESDSDSENKIKFEPTHFNPESSSDDETHFTKGLHFAEINTDSTDAKTAGTLKNRVGIVKNLTDLGSNLLATLKTDETSKRSDSSDSDFEIINSDEANNL